MQHDSGCETEVVCTGDNGKKEYCVTKVNGTEINKKKDYITVMSVSVLNGLDDNQPLRAGVKSTWPGDCVMEFIQLLEKGISAKEVLVTHLALTAFKELAVAKEPSA